MRRRIPSVLLLAALITGISAIPASAETITVTGQGPTETGALVELFCPVAGHEFLDGSVTFYRHEGARRPMTTVPLTESEVSESGNTIAPKGARYYTATATCEQPVMLDFSGHLEAGQQAQVLCPSETPILVAASPTTYVDVLGGAYLLDQTTVTNEAGRPIGVSFTAPEAGSWNVTLHCSTVDTPL